MTEIYKILEPYISAPPVEDSLLQSMRVLQATMTEADADFPTPDTLAAFGVERRNLNQRLRRLAATFRSHARNHTTPTEENLNAVIWSIGIDPDTLGDEASVIVTKIISQKMF